MKKYIVIGNPIEHSLSPKLHNFWIKENNLDAVYDKRLIKLSNIKNVIEELKNNTINGINVTLPFKKDVISFIDELTPLAKAAQSVNTIFKSNNKIIGDNTDITGFEHSLKHIQYNVKNKNVFILGAGGVALAIILALKRMGASKIFLSNRTRKQPEDLKIKYPDLEIVDWGESPDFDMIINATSLGLHKDDNINLNYKKIGSNKLFYDVIYNPSKTNFLLTGEQTGNKIENGKMMFVYQAQLAFKIWHNILPKINDYTVNLLNT